jgi:hypothetical protein
MIPTPTEIERLLRAVEDLSDVRAREAARALVRALLDWHRAGLERLLCIVSSSTRRADDLLRELESDDVIGGLVLLHELSLADSKAVGDAPSAPAVPSGFVPVERLTRNKRDHHGSCGLCSAALADDHRHVLERGTRKPTCSCDACAILLTAPADGRYRRIPRRVSALAGFRMDESTWLALGVPVALAFFTKSEPAPAVIVACYPGPAGAVEAVIDEQAWATVVAENPALGELEPEVEALLVNRLEPGPEYYRVPIDECFRLVGSVRSNWQGISGGRAVSAAVAEFFASLRKAAA